MAFVIVLIDVVSKSESELLSEGGGTSHCSTSSDRQVA